MKSTEIRQRFLNFFTSHGHTVVPSSSLIPAEDPTLLFANAGMNQFKDLFLGKQTRSYTRATSIQKCMRAGGKHNDLDIVGFTKRHLTFFEMMGNFSFGDYFKKEAIEFAWNFVTIELALAPENILVTVFKDDDQSYDIWHTHIGLAKEKIFKLGEADNFWQMGDTGPCGPCTELYVDRGSRYGCGKNGCSPGCDCDRFLEFWNLVFMQYDRQIDGSVKELERTGVDTGMGFERLALIMQDKNSVFETDLFAPLIAKIESLTGIQYAYADVQSQAACNVIIDHVRASCFLIADGCSPENDGRGYVLRKLIRRAALFEQKITKKNIFMQIAQVVIDQMKEVYPELETSRQAIMSLLSTEVERFRENLIHGTQILQEYLKLQTDDKRITGQQAFKLYDTYGFPHELTVAMARQRGYTVDVNGFEKYMQEQRIRSGKKQIAHEEQISFTDEVITEFTGYDQTVTQSTIVKLVESNREVERAGSGATVWIIPKQSPFYVEKGGQVSDQGWVTIKEYRIPIEQLKTIDTAIAIKVTLPIAIAVNDGIVQEVDMGARLNTMKNHTATHLLQAALMELFGKQVKQAGSLVCPEYLRFDFTYHKPVTPEDVYRLEQIINQKIWENIAVNTIERTYRDAVDQGVIAFFGDKYNPDAVRVVSIPEFSAELCGGTHVQATGEIGVFKITEVSALSAGQKRIIALTGPKALERFHDDFSSIKRLSNEFKLPAYQIHDAVKKQQDQIKRLQNQVQLFKTKLWRCQLPTWLAEVREINGVPFGCILTEQYDMPVLREIAHALEQERPGLYLIISQDGGKASFIVIVSSVYAQKIDILALSNWLLQEYGLRGGGTGRILQGGGPMVPKNFATAFGEYLSAR